MCNVCFRTLKVLWEGGGAESPWAAHPPGPQHFCGPFAVDRGTRATAHVDPRLPEPTAAARVPTSAGVLIFSAQGFLKTGLSNRASVTLCTGAYHRKQLHSRGLLVFLLAGLLHAPPSARVVGNA